ncbi:sarcosine oxidase subunit beta family protein [Aquincola sp. S2]|uniref:Sarcosine oxidase subunit beta family protein n=1 Tax=Pseudaquabacterium terrae TaxID=2732868 RepID=A0ABX2EV03_9BURK|nr:sarcosine oxidase subunit beta family protein [Aquabacterium terrae]NRF72296.1 sarcosine oxidase subunit beta family protein [Aquabacterium terrae]
MSGQNYSLWSLLKHGLRQHRTWEPAWKRATLAPSYDVVIVGGGGHGLATAYYLAKAHRVGRIAVLEKGWLGGGNTARNTTIVRSNYLWDEAALLYEHALKLWERLSAELNFNVMFSQRGVFNLGHTLQDMRDIERRVNANNLQGIDAQVLTAAEVKHRIPQLDASRSRRYPVLGASWQPRAGVAHHDAVARGFARAASRLGVHLIEGCEVTGLEVEGGRIKGLQTTLGAVKADRVGCVASGHSSMLARMAGIRLPLQSHPLQAFVSESMQRVIDTVIMSNAVHGYLSQSDKGELVIGAGIDSYLGYGQRGSPHVIDHTAAAVIELFPQFSRVRMNRQWGGIVDVSPDACPIIGKTAVQGLYFNCGWGTGGFKATPGSGHVFAHTIAHDRPHPLAEAFSLERFASGRLIDEHGAAAVAH